MQESTKIRNRSELGRGVFQAILLAAIMFTSLGSYLLVLRWRGPAATVVTWIPADDWFPFWPSWVWVYLIPYLIGPRADRFGIAPYLLVVCPQSDCHRLHYARHLCTFANTNRH